MSVLKRCLFTLLFAALGLPALPQAQEINSQPGQYDFYLLNLSWAPEFCSTLNTLTPGETAARGGVECTTPHGFVLHGLWPQNFNGTYPGNCGSRSGPADWQQYFDMTPDISLLKHEWVKHGTCTTLAPDAFFSAARRAYASVVVPPALTQSHGETMQAPAAILQMFYSSNPAFPQGSFALSCGHNALTAIEACFSRDLQPIACQNISSCRAGIIVVEGEGQPARR